MSRYKSRAKRLSEALEPIEYIKLALEDVKSDLDEAISELGNVDFPGMY